MSLLKLTSCFAVACSVPSTVDCLRHLDNYYKNIQLVNVTACKSNYPVLAKLIGELVAEQGYLAYVGRCTLASSCIAAFG